MSTFAPGSFCWADLVPGDQAGAIAFYRELFGWIAEPGPAEFGGYGMAHLGRQDPLTTVAGISGPVPGTDPLWKVYLATDDIDATVAAVLEQGGRVVMPVMDVPGAGRMALVAGSAGGGFGLWQAAGHTGFGIFGEPGAFCWAELYSTDAAASRDFFAALFGLEGRVLEESDAFTYYQMAVPGAEAPQFGVMQIGPQFPPGSASFFAGYLWVDDVDATGAAAAARGATIIDAPVDTPFGRMTTLTDPDGALIKIVDPTRVTGPTPSV